MSAPLLSSPRSKRSSQAQDLDRLSALLQRRLEAITLEQLRLQIRVETKVTSRELRARASDHPMPFAEAYLPHLVPKQMAPFQAWSLNLQMQAKRAAIAIPRDHGKTTLNGTVFPLWGTCTGRFREILLIGSSDDMASILMQAWKAEIEQNEALWRDWGVRPGKKWAAMDADVLVRDPETGHTHTVKWHARGQGCKMRGFHPALLLAEDVEDEMDMESTAVRTKFFSWWWRVVGGMMRPEAYWHMVGTIVHPLSMMAELTEAPPPGWSAIRLGAIQTVVDNGVKRRVPLWPDMWPLSRLDAKAAEMGSEDFAKEYLNSLRALAGRQSFKHKHLLYYDQPPDPLLVALTLDPSTGQVTPWSIVVKGTDINGDWWVLDVMEELSEPPAMIDAFFGALDTWQPSAVGIEQVAGAKLLAFTLPEEARRRKIDLPEIQEVGGGTNTTKEARIRALLPMFEQRRIHMRREHVALRDGLLRFPRRPIDTPDALSMHMDLAMPEARPQDAEDPNVEPKEGSFAWAVRKQQERNRRRGAGSGMHEMLKAYA